MRRTATDSRQTPAEPRPHFAKNKASIQSHHPQDRHSPIHSSDSHNTSPPRLPVEPKTHPFPPDQLPLPPALLKHDNPRHISELLQRLPNLVPEVSILMDIKTPLDLGLLPQHSESLKMNSAALVLYSSAQHPQDEHLALITASGIDRDIGSPSVIAETNPGESNQLD